MSSATTSFRPRRRCVAGILAGVAGLWMLPGCTDGFPSFDKPPKQPAEQSVATPPPPSGAAQPRLAAASADGAANMTRRPQAGPARADIDLSVIYYERILVPTGSDLTIQVRPAGARTPMIKKTTTQSGLPYKVSVPVSTDMAAYPMTVHATLTSTVGHVLSGSVTLDARPTKPVEILIRTQAE